MGELVTGDCNHEKERHASPKETGHAVCFLAAVITALELVFIFGQATIKHDIDVELSQFKFSIAEPSNTALDPVQL